MDLNALMSSLLSDDSLNEVSKKAGVSTMDAAGVLAAALPSLLNGAAAQAENKETVQSFHEACTNHAGKNPKAVDLDEGQKIVGHLLGSDAEVTERALAKKTGLSTGKIALILAAAAPLLMNGLGQHTTSNHSSSANSTANLIGSLLGGSSSGGMNPLVTSALAGVLGSAIGGNSHSNSHSNNNLLGSLMSAATGSSNASVAGNMLGSLLGGSQPASGSANLLGSLMGAALGGNTQSGHTVSHANQQQQNAAGLGNLLLSLLK